MSSVYKFFGNLIGLIYSNTSSLGLAVIMVCVLLKLLFITTTNKYYTVPVMSKAMEPLVDEIREKYRHNPEKQTKAVSEFLISYQYPVFSYIFYYLFMLALGALLCLSIHSPETYVTGFKAGASRAFLIVPDVTEFTFRALAKAWPEVDTIGYLIFPIVGCALQYFQDEYISRSYLINKTWFDYTSLAVTVAAMAVLPAAFAVFWSVYQLGNIIQIFVGTRKKNYELKKPNMPGDDEDDKKPAKPRKKKK